MSKDAIIKFRVNKKEKKMFSNLCKEKNKNPSEVLRDIIKKAGKKSGF